MQKKMLVLSAAIMGLSLSPLTLAGGHDADEVMMASMPPECMAAMDIMVAAGVDPDNLGDHQRNGTMSAINQSMDRQ